MTSLTLEIIWVEELIILYIVNKLQPQEWSNFVDRIEYNDSNILSAYNYNRI